MLCNLRFVCRYHREQSGAAGLQRILVTSSTAPSPSPSSSSPLVRCVRNQVGLFALWVGFWPNRGPSIPSVRLSCTKEGLVLLHEVSGSQNGGSWNKEGVWNQNCSHSNNSMGKMPNNTKNNDIQIRNDELILLFSSGRHPVTYDSRKSIFFATLKANIGCSATTSSYFY